MAKIAKQKVVVNEDFKSKEMEKFNVKLGPCGALWISFPASLSWMIRKKAGDMGMSVEAFLENATHEFMKNRNCESKAA